MPWLRRSAVAAMSSRERNLYERNLELVDEVQRLNGEIALLRHTEGAGAGLAATVPMPRTRSGQPPGPYDHGGDLITPWPCPQTTHD